MTDSPKTATPGQATVLIGAALAIALVLGYAVLPLLHPEGSGLVGAPAAKFTLPVLTGGEQGSRVSLSDLRGKVVVLDFWASWCGPCRAEAPIIDSFARRHDGKGVVVIGVTTNDDDPPRAVRFVASHNIGYTTVLDADDSVASAFRIRELPTLVVIDAAGVIRAVRRRMVPEEELEDLVAAAAKPRA